MRTTLLNLTSHQTQIMTTFHIEAHTTCYPRLSCVARDYLAITATSASIERVFSAGKDLLGISRFCLKPTTTEACMCLRFWLRAGIQLMEGQGANININFFSDRFRGLRHFGSSRPQRARWSGWTCWPSRKRKK